MMLVHAILPASRANGPGLRAVVFFQGCSLGCAKCFNGLTHLFHGAETTTEQVVHAVKQARNTHVLEGMTFSGGEPMQQADSLLELMRMLQGEIPALSFGMFSGYTERELATGRYFVWNREMAAGEKRHLWQEIQTRLDFAVLGRFNYLQPANTPLRASRNQALRMFSARYKLADFDEQVTEVNIDETGLAQLTGFPILGLPW